eukprot:5686136-Prymnesium_polylepis.1
MDQHDADSEDLESERSQERAVYRHPDRRWNNFGGDWRGPPANDYDFDDDRYTKGQDDDDEQGIEVSGGALHLAHRCDCVCAYAHTGLHQGTAHAQPCAERPTHGAFYGATYGLSDVTVRDRCRVHRTARTTRATRTWAPAARARVEGWQRLRRRTTRHRIA